MPAMCNITAMNANVIRILVTGSARMFVSRKYLGNVPNVSHASGPVNIWQETVSAEASQILRGIFSLSANLVFE